MDKSSFVMYTKYLRHIQKLTMEQRGMLFTAILSYASDQEMPELDAATDMAFSFIQEQMDRDNAAYTEKCRKRSEAGKLGGRPKANAFNENQSKAKKANGFSEKQNNPDTDTHIHIHSHNQDDELKEKKNIDSLVEANKLFERVWKMYPNKKGKGQVSDAQKKRLLAIGEDRLVKAIERYSLELQKDAGWRNPQYGSTFFNSGYVDYLDENYVPGRIPVPTKKNAFNNCTPRDPDYGDLESRLLNNGLQHPPSGERNT